MAGDVLPANLSKDAKGHLQKSTEWCESSFTMKILEVISFPGRGKQSSLLWGHQDSFYCGGSHFLGAQGPSAYLICGSFSENTPGSSCSWKAASSGTFKWSSLAVV